MPSLAPNNSHCPSPQSGDAHRERYRRERSHEGCEASNESLGGERERRPFRVNLQREPFSKGPSRSPGLHPTSPGAPMI